MVTLSAIPHMTDPPSMASLNKIPPVLPMAAAAAPLQGIHPPHFFIAPNYTLTTNTSDTTIPGIAGLAGAAPWPSVGGPTSATLRPAIGGSGVIPCYNPSPGDVYYGQCLLPINNRGNTIHDSDKLSTPAVTSDTSGAVVPPSMTTTGNGDLVLIDQPIKPNKRQRKSSLNLSEETPVKIKKESASGGLCAMRNDSTAVAAEHDNKISYPVSALIDIPGSLTRASRTSSLSSSLSTVRFGGSLSQLWAASLSSISGRINSMKSTGNIHAEAASLPSLGNQYFAFGGSLPELSLTSLSRLLPPSSSTTNCSTSSSISAAAPSSTNLLTVLQPPLYVYPSQPHLATPFINANGSITFGSFLSTGSSLCSTQKPDSPVKDEDSPRQQSITPTDSNINHSISSTPATTGCHGNGPGSLNTLAYVASAQKTLDTDHQQQQLQCKLTPISEQSPTGTGPSSHMGMSPTTEPVTAIGRMECQSLSPLSDQRIKMEDEEDAQSMGSYSEVKPYFVMMSPVNHSGNPATTPNATVISCKKEGKDKPYKCDYPGCGRSFSFPAHLKSHVQQIHISYRPCKCDFPGCGKRFYTPQHLNVHRRIHTGERPFVCPYSDCNKAFTTAGNLKNHIRTHTGERPYACKFEGCTKRFAEMSSLKKHELTHTGEKPYKCRVCGKAFSQAGSRNTHERKHNRTESDSKVSRRYRIKRVTNDEDSSDNNHA